MDLATAALVKDAFSKVTGVLGKFVAYPLHFQTSSDALAEGFYFCFLGPKSFAIPSTCERVFEWKCMGQNLTFLGWQGFLGIFLVLLIEYRSKLCSWCYSCCTHCNGEEHIILSESEIPEDEDVAEERRRVHVGSDDEVLRIVDLIKVHHPVLLDI